jgi:fatty-acyl-CoA synthase
VRDAVVVGIPDARFGEKVCAVVDMGEAAPLSLADLTAHVKGRLADYKIPRAMVAAAVVRAANGKVDYKAIRAQALEVLGVKA